MTKQEIWDGLATPEAKQRIERVSFGDQLARAWAAANAERRRIKLMESRHDQSDILDAFEGDRHYPPSANFKGHES